MIRIKDIKRYIVGKKHTIKDAVRVIDDNKDGIALVVDGSNALCGIITDGDIRRFILKNGDISEKCKTIMNSSYVYTLKDDLEEIKRLMTENRIRHIPLVGHRKNLLKFFVSDKIYEPRKNVVAVIMAGGEGKRLRAITNGMPKPLLKIRDKSILEEIIVNLKQHKITDIYLALGYKAGVFKKYFQKVFKSGIDLKYLIEKKKLGTVGALSLLLYLL